MLVVKRRHREHENAAKISFRDMMVRIRTLVKKRKDESRAGGNFHGPLAVATSVHQNWHSTGLGMDGGY